jgi:hypothetical protein
VNYDQSLQRGYNIAEEIFFEPEFADLCGFREEEIANACGMDNKKADEAIEVMRIYYNGNNFHSMQI